LALIVVVGAAVGAALALAFRPPMGIAVPTSPPGQILPIGSDPGPYSTDPPTSGAHFPIGLHPGFYDVDSASTLPANVAGYLVANLEQGDVVIWYRCEPAPGACAEMTDQIRTTMRLLGEDRIIAFPWPSLAEPVVLTSWGVGKSIWRSMLQRGYRRRELVCQEEQRSSSTLR